VLCASHPLWSAEVRCGLVRTGAQLARTDLLILPISRAVVLAISKFPRSIARLKIALGWLAPSLPPSRAGRQRRV
jgi:hypothetical protein